MRTEQERQRLLGELGVTLWYARTPLPGAAPSASYHFAENEGKTVPGPAKPLPGQTKTAPRSGGVEFAAKRQASDAASKPVSRVESPAGRLAEVGQPGTVVKPVQTLPTQAETSASGDGAENLPEMAKAPLCFLKIRCEAGILLAPTSTEGVENTPEYRLFANIARAATKTTDSSLSAIDVFQWPPLPQGDLPGHTRPLRDKLLIEWLGVNTEIKQVLYLGDSLPDTFGNIESRFSVGLPSLSQMIAEPTRKRALWDAMQKVMVADD